MPELIPIFQSHIAEETVTRVADVLRSGWISEGRQVQQFEKALCRQFSFPRALALNSGTAALHLAVLALGLKAGDEVVTTAQSFVSTALAILYAGAVPVFADLEAGGPNIDPEDVRRKISPRTKGILVVHYGGEPCNMDGVLKVASEHSLWVIEDAAHALGAQYRSRPVGTIGDAGIFSFQAAKALTTGDGGLLVCKNESAHQLAYRLRWLGIDRENRKPSELGQPEWDIKELGYKYHMNDIAAALGLGQVEGYPRVLARRRALEAHYRDVLASQSGVSLLKRTEGGEGASWLFTVLVERRLDFVRAIKSRGVYAAAWHRRIDKHSLLGGVRTELPQQERFDSMQVSVPMRDTLTDQEVAQILGAIKQGW